MDNFLVRKQPSIQRLSEQSESSPPAVVASQSNPIQVLDENPESRPSEEDDNIGSFRLRSELLPSRLRTCVASRRQVTSWIYLKGHCIKLVVPSTKKRPGPSVKDVIPTV